MEKFSDRVKVFLIEAEKRIKTGVSTAVAKIIAGIDTLTIKWKNRKK